MIARHGRPHLRMGAAWALRARHVTARGPCSQPCTACIAARLLVSFARPRAARGRGSRRSGGVQRTRRAGGQGGRPACRGGGSRQGGGPCQRSAAWPLGWPQPRPGPSPPPSAARLAPGGPHARAQRAMITGVQVRRAASLVYECTGTHGGRVAGRRVPSGTRPLAGRVECAGGCALLPSCPLAPSCLPVRQRPLLGSPSHRTEGRRAPGQERTRSAPQRHCPILCRLHPTTPLSSPRPPPHTHTSAPPPSLVDHVRRHAERRAAPFRRFS